MYTCLCSSKVITWGDTKPFVPPVTSGYVIKVYDGDTITIASKLPYKNSPLYRFSVRLAGIDTPELRTQNKAELKAAIAAKEALSNKILNKKVQLKDVKLEKYGRILANVFCDGCFLNDWMLTNNFAVVYNGGKKQVFSIRNQEIAKNHNI